MVEHALRREIAFDLPPVSTTCAELNSFGFPVLKKQGRSGVTSELIYQLLDELGV